MSLRARTGPHLSSQKWCQQQFVQYTPNQWPLMVDEEVSTFMFGEIE